ncbi:peptidoglycan DD-metalloendopeptidase family protein [Ulvibacterium sp.]|uniref:peptidoglycan DD-metalloendopeptidase family protein n=1 Tax=Ulvibacterium sp. TaxID=2665914 RepID=UPI003CC6228C
MNLTINNVIKMFLVFLVPAFSIVNGQIPKNLIQGNIENLFVKEAEDFVYYLGSTGRKLVINNTTVVENSDAQYRLFISKINKNNFEVERSWQFESARGFTITSYAINGQHHVISGSFNGPFNLSTSNIPNEAEGSFIFYFNAANESLKLDFVSRDNIVIDNISIFQDDRILLTGIGKASEAEILGQKLNNPENDLFSFLVEIDFDFTILSSQVIPNLVIHDAIFLDEDRRVYVGTSYNTTSQSGSSILIRENEMVVAQINRFGNIGWSRKLSGKSSCSKMTAKLLFDDVHEVLLIGGYYCGESDEIPLGYYHGFLSRILPTGELAWFKRVNNMPFSTTSVDLLRKDESTYEMRMFHQGDMIVSGYEFPKSDASWMSFHFSKDAVLKNIVTRKDSWYSQAHQNIMINKEFENKDYINYKVSMMGNSVDSPIDGQYIRPNEINSGYFLVFSVKGVDGFGHAGVILVKSEESQSTILNSHLLLSKNSESGYNASYGIIDTGDAVFDIENYRLGLRYERNSLPEELKSNILTSNSTRYILEILESEVEALEGWINTQNELESGKMLDIVNSSYSDKQLFYAELEKDFIELGTILDFDFTSKGESLLPRRLHSILREEFFSQQLVSLNSDAFSYQYNLLLETIPNDGNLIHEYKNGEIVLSNGQLFNYKVYDGAVKEGKPNGIGELDFEMANHPYYRQFNLKYKGEFKNGLFEGKGVVYQDTLKLFEGVFEKGKLKTGWEHKYYYRNNREISRCQILNGKKEGSCYYFFPLLSTDAISRIQQYKNGIPEGASYTFYPLSQKIKTYEFYKHGIKEGETISYFYDGKVYNSQEDVYKDVRTSIRKEVINDTVNHYYADYDPEGHGNLLFYTTDYVDWNNLELTPKFENITYEDRIFSYSNGNKHTVKNELSVVQFYNGDVLISNYGFNDELFFTSMSMGGVIPAKNHGKKENFYGPYKLYLADNSVLTGKFENGIIDGKASYLTPRGEVQQVTVKDGKWNWTFQERERSSNFFKGGVQFLTHATLDLINGLGEGICNILGKDVEEGEDCNLGGAEVDQDGNVTLIDSEGNAVPKDPNANSNIHIYVSYEYTEFDDELIFDGTKKFIEEAKGNTTAVYGKPWPGMQRGESIYPPNGTGQIRFDGGGSGDFLSRRKNSKTGKRYKHKGIDYKMNEGDPVIAPVSGEVDRISPAYTTNNNGLTAIVIKNAGYEAKVLYVKPSSNIKKGSKVVQGVTVLGTVQDINVKHSKDTTDHIHIELIDDEGRIIPPNGIYPLQ